MFKKMMLVAAAGVFSAAMATGALADDISVRTSIGSGEVVFTQTDKTADITAAELTARVKDALKKAGDLDAFDALLDAEADISIKLGEENQMGIQASAICSVEEFEHKEHASLFYSLEGLGEPQSSKYEAYHWAKDDVHYTSVSDGSGWKTKVENVVEEIAEYITSALDSDEVNQISLDGLLPNLYEEDGKQYYVCVMDKDMLLNAADVISQIEAYLSMADSILADNDLKLTVVVNADTGLVRAVSLNASGASGQIPGDILGAEGTALEFNADQLYTTFLLNPEGQDFTIPDEVLNAPVESEEESLEGIMSNLGGMLSGVSG